MDGWIIIQITETLNSAARLNSVGAQQILHLGSKLLAKQNVVVL